MPKLPASVPHHIAQLLDCTHSNQMVQMSFLTQIAKDEAMIVARNMRRHVAAYAIPYGTISANTVAIAGQEGHLFIGDGANHWEQQIFGRLALTPNWAARWHQVLAMRAQIAGKTGVRLVHLVMPEKQICLPDLRWHRIEDLGFPMRPLQHLPWQMAGLPEPVYPAAAITAMRDHGPTYWPGNSHCTPSSCLVAAEQVLQAFGITERFEATNTMIETFYDSHDLLSHFRQTPPKEENIRIKRPGEIIALRDMRAESGNSSGSYFATHNSAASVEGRLAIFGDSYSWGAGIANSLAGIFQETHFLWSKDIVWDYVAAHRISHVLWESAERFLITPPQR